MEECCAFDLIIHIQGYLNKIAMKALHIMALNHNATRIEKKNMLLIKVCKLIHTFLVCFNIRLVLSNSMCQSISMGLLTCLISIIRASEVHVCKCQCMPHTLYLPFYHTI